MGYLKLTSFRKWGSKQGKWVKKAGRKKNFHFGHFVLQKVKKVTKLRIGGYAAGLPGWFNARTLVLQIRSPRTQEKMLLRSLFSRG